MKMTQYDDLEETVYTLTLNNGLKVTLIPKKEMFKTFGIFATQFGSIDRTFKPLGGDRLITVPDGIAHFLEHKLFEKEDHDVFSTFSQLGASVNAYTSSTKTAYLFSCTDHVEENLTTLIDFVQDPYFSEASVEKEKGIIAQEIMMYEDQPDWQAYMGTIKNLFANHPVNKDIAGTVESIQRITVEDLYMCYNTFYHPSNMMLLLIGQFDIEKVIPLIENNQAAKTFPPLSKIQRGTIDETRASAKQEDAQTMNISVPKCTVGVKTSTRMLEGEAFLKHELCQSIVLDYYFSIGGPYYQRLYDKNLIDDRFQVSSELEKSYGFSMISSYTNDPKTFADEVKQLLLNIHLETIDEEAFLDMKKKRMGQLLQAMNVLEFTANQYVHYHSLNVDFFSLIPHIQALQLEEINTFLKNWITEDQLTVFTIHPA